MRKNMKSISIMLALLLAFSIVGSDMVIASDNQDYIFIHDMGEIDQFISPNAIGGEVLIFFAGILVGAIIDGVLIVYTDKDLGTWASVAINYLRGNPGVSSIHISSSGRVHGGGGGDF